LIKRDQLPLSPPIRLVFAFNKEEGLLSCFIC